MDMDTQERKKCGKCRVNLLLKEFKKRRDDNYTSHCNVCLDKSKKHRDKHREKNKEKNKDKFVCEKCDAKFSTKGNLKAHNKIVHDKIKDYVCEQCEYKCSENSHLQYHIKMVHDKIKDYVCEYENCEMKFSTNNNLQMHIKAVHLKIKEHMCEYENCGYKCITSNHLQYHIKHVHDKIKDYKCDQCEYKCSTNSHLKRHIKALHDNIKDIECEQCNYKCSSNGNLQKHIKAVHLKIRDFKCIECPFTASENSTLKEHIKLCTGNEHISSGEYQVRKCLRKMKIEHEHNTSYIVKDKQLLRWDFILYDEENNIKGFIEYDGRQHFIPVCFNGISQERAEERLRTSQIRDNIKNEFCKENNYPLLRIPYTEFGNIPDLVTKFAIKYLDWGDE